DLPGREHGRRERVRDPRRAHLCDAWLDRARHELPPAGGGPGHEIGHVDLRHSARQIEQARAASLGVGLGYIVLGREPGAAENAALNVVAAAVFAKFSREDERAADHAAVRYTTAAGIDPDGLVE